MQKKLNITDILLSKASKQELAHFYIMRAPQTIQQQDLYLEEWVNTFLIGFIAGQKQCDLQLAEKILQFDVADILQLRKSADRKKFVVDDISPLFQFVELRPFEFKTKIAIVHQAHLLDTTVSNKLLKLLEEPTDNTIIFFLFGTHGHALQTIESRAINIQLSTDNQQQVAQPTLSQYLQTDSISNHRKKLIAYLRQELSLADLLDYIHKRGDAESEIIGEITNLYSYYGKSFIQHEQCRQELEKYEKHKVLNMPIKTRIFPLIQMAKKDFTL